MRALVRPNHAEHFVAGLNKLFNNSGPNEAASTSNKYATRRRTPGLRREEVAQRANVSVTWYTWLKQGRGGSPSPEGLDRLAYALTLTDSEREHLFILATGRPPAPTHELLTTIAPRLQRVLDSMGICPALIKNCAWDIVAWNQAAELMFPHFNTGNADDRNVLRKMFLDPNMMTNSIKSSVNAVAII